MNYALSQHLPLGFGAIGFKNLLEIRHYAVAGNACITEYGIKRFLLGNRFHGFVGDVLIETGNEVVIRNGKDFFAVDGVFLDLGRQQHAEVKHDLEQQILRRSIFLDVVSLKFQLALLRACLVSI